MIEISKPDGVIEIGTSGCGCCPPGKKAERMHTNVTSSWWRTSGDWHKIPRSIGAFEAKELAEDIESCQEFKELMADDDV